MGRPSLLLVDLDPDPDSGVRVTGGAVEIASRERARARPAPLDRPPPRVAPGARRLRRRGRRPTPSSPTASCCCRPAAGRRRRATTARRARRAGRRRDNTYIFITIGYHVRSAEALAARYDATVHGPPQAAQAPDKEATASAAGARRRARPGGVVAHAIGRPRRGETPLSLPVPPRARVRRRARHHARGRAADVVPGRRRARPPRVLPRPLRADPRAAGRPRARARPRHPRRAPVLDEAPPPCAGRAADAGSTRASTADAAAPHRSSGTSKFHLPKGT